MEHPSVKVSRRRRPEWLLASLASAASLALLHGDSGNAWMPLVAGVFAAAFALLPSFRTMVQEELRRAWNAASDFPLESRKIPWRAVLLLVVLPDALFLLLRDAGMQSGDSRPVVLTAANLVTRGSAELSNFAESYTEARLFTSTDEPPYFFLRCPGGYYSHYPSGMLPFALPIVAASDWLGADLDSPTVHSRLEKLTAAWVSAACLGLFFLLALHIVAPTPAYAMTAILATGSAMFSTVGQALWQHGGVIFWTETLLLAEFRCFRAPNARTTLLQGAACAMMMACRLSAGVMVVLFGAWVFVRAPLRALAIAAVAAACLAPWAAVQQSVYGKPLGPMSVQMNGQFWDLKAGACCGVLFSPTHGLLVYQPWLLLGLLLLAPAVRKRMAPSRAPLPAGWQAWSLLAIGAHLAVVCSWCCWWGGWCWGSRLPSDAIPLAALLTLAPLSALLATARGRTLVGSLAVLSALMHVPSVYLRQTEWYCTEATCREERVQWRWSAPPFLFPLRR